MRSVTNLFLSGLLALLLTPVAWGQTTIFDEPLRDGAVPTGWTADNVSFQTAAGGYAQFGADATLTTPVLDFTGFDSVELTFAVAKYGAGGDGPITVRFSTDGGDTFDAFTFDSPTPTDDNYLNSGPTVLPVTGDNVVIRFTRENSPSQKRLRDVVLTGTMDDGSPALSFTGTFLAFETIVGTPSAAQSVMLSGSNLSGDVSVMAPMGFEVALSEGGPFDSALSLTPSDGSVSETVFARLTGVGEGSFSGDLTATSAGAQSASRALSGTVGPQEPAEPGEPVVLVEWDFNAESLVATGGTPANAARTVSIVGASFNDYAAGRGTGQAANSRDWNTDEDRFWLVSFSSSGFEDLRLNSYQRGSNTGPRDFVVEFRVGDMGVWTALTNVTVANDNFITGAVVDLALPAETADQPLVQVRWRNTSAVSVSDGTVGATGTNRIDDIRVAGVAIDSAPLARTLDEGQGWYLLAPPTGSVTPEHLAGISLVQGIPGFFESSDGNFYTGYTGDPADNTGTNSNGFTRPRSSIDPLESGRGFVWYHWASPIETGGPSVGQGLPVTLTATGASPETTVTTTFTADDRGASDDDFFLLGNPFGEAFCVSNLSVSNPEAVLSSFVQTHVPSTGYVLRSETETVQPWDGFFAQVTGHDFEADGPLTFTMAGGGCDAFGPNGPILLPFDVEPLPDDDDGDDDDDGRPVQVGADRAALVLLDPDASTGWDRYDLGKLRPLGSRYVTVAPVGASASGGTIRKAIESRPLPHDEPVEIVMSLQTTHAGTFRLRMGDVPMESVPTWWQIELRDTVTGLSIDPREADLVFDATPTADSRRFVLRIDPQGVSVEEGGEALAFGVESVHPNPASAQATVAFTLPEAAETSVQVFDLLGRAVTTLTEARLEAGRHTVTLDAATLSSGVYVVRLTAAGQVATQRLTIVR